MNAKTLHLFLMLLFTCAFTARAQYSGGSGTAEDPYQIATLTDLKDLSLTESHWKSHFILKNDIDASVTSDWDDGAGTIVGFKPIGYHINNSFLGVFDGKGYTISNLYINRPTESNVGLFGYLGDNSNFATIKNIHLKDADITGYTYVGGLSGYGAYASINNVSVSGIIAADGVSRVYAGGIVGYLKGEIVNSKSSGTVTAADYVGGLVGYLYYKPDFEYAAFRCSSSVTVTATSASRSYSGGLAGYIYGKVNGCYSTGTVSGGSYVGGFAGNFSYSSGVISNCFATGNVSSTYTTSAYTGGFIGYSTGTVLNCYYLGTLSTVGTKYIGAFVGYYSAYSPKLYNCFYNSDTGISQDVDGISGISMASFALQSSFPEWDFASDWEMGINTEVSASSLPYPKALLYDSYISYDQTITSAGTVSGDKGWYNNGDQITFTASAAVSPYVFAGWYKGIEKLAETQSYTTTVNGDAKYTARYKAEYSGGEGTEAEPYEIANLDDLQLLIDTEEDFDKYFILINDIDAKETSTWVDDNDVDKKGFTPIGNYESKKFTGSFDGQGYTISNLYIDRPIDPYTGFFGYTSFAEIKNLNLLNHTIIGGDNTGALIGSSANTDLENCSANGSVQGKTNVGGLLGKYSSGMTAGVSKGKLENCYSEGSVKGSGTYAGGLVGIASGEIIERCYSKANVSGYQTVGGFVGRASSDLQYCYATGDVEGRCSVGGFEGQAGSSQSSVSFCFATGSVSQKDLGSSQDEYGYVGGFIGEMTSYSYVEYCYSTGEVTKQSKYGGFYGDLGMQVNNYKIENCVYDYETSDQPDQNRDGITALSTAQFADIANYPAGWDEEWEIGVIEAIDTKIRSYSKVLLGYDYQIYYEIENNLAGSVSSDKGQGWFKDGDEITLTVTTDFGYKFDGWYIDEEKVSDELVYTFTASQFATYTAKHIGTPLTFSGGSGTALNPYKISTLDDLILMGNRIVDVKDSHFILINDIDASASTNLNDGLGFAPIGEFWGTFNGDGYTISELYINRPSESKVGLFSYLYNASVSGLNMQDCNITGGDETGTLCGRLHYEALLNRCNITGGSVNGSNSVGGMLGMGFSYISYTWGKIAKLNYCSVEDITISGGTNVGGLVGDMKGVINSSYASATVNGDSNVGGLVGLMQGDSGLYTEFSYAKSIVTAKNAAGGLVGYMQRSANIKKSYAIADVTLKEGSGTTDGYGAGGLVGYINASTITDSYSVGSISGLDFMGGLVGSAASRSSISNCYTTVGINAFGSTNAGLIATIDNDNVTVTDCYFDTELTGYSEGVKVDATEISAITALTTAESALEASFTSFDFDGVWNVLTNSEIDDNARPYLKWETNSTNITVSAQPENRGNVFGEGWFNLGDEVTLTAQTLPGWKVEMWKNGSDTVSVNASYVFDIEEDAIYNLSVIFVEDFSAAGEGTEAFPYEITSLDQLEQLGYLPSLWDKHFILMNDIDASATSDWNMADHDQDIQTPEVPLGFSPLGDHNTYGFRDRVAFTGNFDGQGYSISGLYINRPFDNYIGVFGFTKGATIKNLTIDAANFLGGSYTGGLVGYTFKNQLKEEEFQSKFENCNIINSKVFANSYVGGFAGNMYYDIVTNCSVQNIDLTSSSYSGGFVGELTYESKIDGCYSTGVMNTYGDNNGGFAGRAVGNCTITNSYSSVNIEGNQQLGGFVGYFGRAGLIRNCHATGSAKAYSPYGLVGGFVGYINNGKIEDCYSTGDVTAIDLFAGGFAGYGDAGDLSHITKCYTTSNVYGRRYLGGFAGQYDGKISYSYATGTVDGSYDGAYGHTDYDIHFAGFVAYLGSNGHIDNSFTFSTVKGFNYVVGFVGVNQGYVESCYSAGELEATGTGMAGFAAYSSEEDQSQVIGCYFDKTLAGTTTAIGAGKVTGVTALETAAFAQEANMPELPFESVWKIGLNADLEDNSRPYLKWEEGGARIEVEFTHLNAGNYSGHGWFVEGEEVSLSVNNVQAGLSFSHWEVDSVSVSTDNPYIFNFSGNKDVVYTAHFVENNIIAEGDGSKDSPYIIKSFEELVCLTNVTSIWDKHFELGNDIDAYDSRIVNQNYGLSPIGVGYEKRFTGNFDGKGFTISNLYINRYDSEYGQALFAHVGDENGDPTVIANVNLSSVLIGGYQGVGALVGQMTNTYIENCKADGEVIGIGSYIGGLVGRSEDRSYIKSSAYKGYVSSPVLTSSIAVGGLVGYSSNTNIEYCYAITDSIISSGSSVGGLVGYSHDIAKADDASIEATYGITKSFAVSKGIKGASSFSGLVGTNNNAFVKESYAVANLYAINSDLTMSGGLIGTGSVNSVQDSYFNSDKDGVVYNGSGKGITTEEFADELIFSSWIFGTEGNWKMAYGQGGEKRPCFYNMDTYTVTFKADENGLVSAALETPVSEITDDILMGEDSRTITAVPDSEYSFASWDIENGGHWDMDNISTYVPGAKSEDMVLVAVFTNNDVSVNDKAYASIQAYPNPVNDILYIDNVLAQTPIRFVNVAGKVVFIENNFNGVSINIAHLNPGAYVMMIETTTGMQKIKVIKK
ncbi:GLUG motif-containing protein [Saccharicrinis aurantiacus]|uniref:GLUG motif-containing protein n=1 Tax=Saccharicrinis aurantiacus TaxID=1849719 RepID=UPI00094FAA5F|nr:GLUG motif-containing protein [Saccharicrinis aurantiacus]